MVAVLPDMWTENRMERRRRMISIPEYRIKDALEVLENVKVKETNNQYDYVDGFDKGYNKAVTFFEDYLKKYLFREYFKDEYPLGRNDWQE